MKDIVNPGCAPIDNGYLGVNIFNSTLNYMQYHWYKMSKQKFQFYYAMKKT